jgi:hypothetical protein
MTPDVTHVGILGSRARAAVDHAGRLQAPAGWRLDWWIGAEDRWHLPEHEAAVRQVLVGGAPVVETAMRVPGGDAVHRVFAVPGPSGSGALVVVEVENRSAVPVALALARHGPGAADAALTYARPPAQQARTSQVDVDVFPLPHTATIRVVVPLEGPAPETLPPLPTATAVAKGWEAQAGRGARVELPDPAFAAALVAARGQLLLAELGDGGLVGESDPRSWAVAGAVVRALDRVGLLPEAERVLLHLADEAGGDVADPADALLALDHHVRIAADDAMARGLVEVVAHLAAALHRAVFRRGRHVRDGLEVSPSTVEAFAAAERLLTRAGELRAARDAAEDSAALRAGVTPDVRAPRLPDLPDSRPSLERAARFAEELLDALLGAHDDRLELAPVVPAGWLGQGWEVHDAPTAAGRVSYAVRWHGERPALLWHVEPHDGSARPLRLTAPGLDPQWSSTELRGEALLSRPAHDQTAGSFS